MTSLAERFIFAFLPAPVVPLAATEMKLSFSTKFEDTAGALPKIIAVA